MLQLSLDSLYKLERLIAFRKVDHVCCWIRNALGDWSSFFTSTRLLCKLGMSLHKENNTNKKKFAPNRFKIRGQYIFQIWQSIV